MRIQKAKVEFTLQQVSDLLHKDRRFDEMGGTKPKAKHGQVIKSNTGREKPDGVSPQRDCEYVDHGYSGAESDYATSHPSQQQKEWGTHVLST